MLLIKFFFEKQTKFTPEYFMLQTLMYNIFHVGVSYVQQLFTKNIYMYYIYCINIFFLSAKHSVMWPITLCGKNMPHNIFLPCCGRK